MEVFCQRPDVGSCSIRLGCCHDLSLDRLRLIIKNYLESSDLATLTDLMNANTVRVNEAEEIDFEGTVMLANEARAAGDILSRFIFLFKEDAPPTGVTASVELNTLTIIRD